jgi:hypothetical protein
MGSVMPRVPACATALCLASLTCGMTAAQDRQPAASPFASKCSLDGPRAAAGARSLPPLPGEADDQDGNIAWVADTMEMPGAVWQTKHRVTNRSQTDNVYVNWMPNVLETWIPKTATRGPMRTSSSPPRQQAGEMYHGKSKKPDSAPWYQATAASVATTSQRTSTYVTLSVQLNSQIRDVFLFASSQVLPREGGSSISYCVELDPDQSDLTKQILIEWTAADSSQLRDAVKSSDGWIRLPEKGPALYEISRVTSPALRDGALIVHSSDRVRLAAANVPAFGPPR